MPSEPLIDLAALDLSATLVGHEELYRVCRQRGRFALLDGLLHLDLTGGSISGFKDLDAGQWWAADHVPGRPLFPGVLMIEGAAQMCSYHFVRLHPELEGGFVGFGGVDDARFRGQVEPPARFVWVGKVERQRRSMFSYRTQGFVERRLVFEATVLGVAI